MNSKDIYFFAVALALVTTVSSFSVSESSLRLSFGNLRDLRQAVPPSDNRRDSDTNRTVIMTIPGDSAKFACPIPLELVGTVSFSQ